MTLLNPVGAGGSGFMTVLRGRRVLSIFFVVTIVFMISSPAYVSADYDVPSDLNVGPFVDRVVYKSVENNILALQSGDLDVLSGGANYAALEGDPDIAIQRMLRLGYGHITINCGKYPLNISAFRRAFAFAFDKNRIITDIWNGEAQAHDSLLPYTNRWCIEDDLPYHYYTAQPDFGNQLLDNAGFDIDPHTGYRLAPDGSEFTVDFWYFPNRWHIGLIPIARDAFDSLHIRAEYTQSEWADVTSLLRNHRDYDMVMYATQFLGDEADYLAYEYWSEYADTNYQNPCNFQNDSFDAWREQLLHNTTYEGVTEALTAMQLILHENVPRIITYQNYILDAYRTDTYTGHVQDRCRAIASQWTWRKIHRIDGTPGGTVYVNFSGMDPETFNIFAYFTIYSSEMLLNLWPTLYSRNPNADPWPYLAKSLLEETHSTNPDVAEGNTRFTIDIVQNATWSDGTPLTAEDVAFTYTYLLETAPLGNAKSVGLEALVAAYAPTKYRVVLEFSTESYWHLSHVAYQKIIPKHIFNPVDGIGYNGWNEWNPVYNPSHPHVTCGPFVLTDWQEGEFYELSANRDFLYYPFRDETDQTSTPPIIPDPIPPNLALAIAVGTVGAAAVIFIGGSIIYIKDYAGVKKLS